MVPLLALRARAHTGWLLRGEVQKLVLVVTGNESGETLERWVFNIDCDKKINEDRFVDATYRA